jgi:HD-GYP domain-containing protein (c-di-GMP phosphodiesterase class II)
MPRAYRENAGVDHAMAEVQAQSGKAFDRRIVSALAQFIDNRGGRALFGASPLLASGISQ